jgi:heme O synthase-like polyprenyltransferase
VRILRSEDERAAQAAFRYSIAYLALLFAALLVDHYAAL